MSIHPHSQKIVAWKPFGDFRSGSGRIRCLNPMEEMQRSGFPVEIFDVERASQYGAVIFSKQYDKSTRDQVRRLKSQNVKTIFDLCDNHFILRPEASPSPREELIEMMELSDFLSSSTQEMAKIMTSYQSRKKPVIVIGDAIEERIDDGKTGVLKKISGRFQSNRLKAFHLEQPPQTLRLVWFGNHGSSHADFGMAHLRRIKDVCERVSKEFPLSLTVISNSRKKYREVLKDWKIPHFYTDWHPSFFLQQLSLHDATVIPIELNPFTICKTNNRLIQSIWAGLGVLADEIPSYSDFREICFLGEWEEGLLTFATQKDELYRRVLAGQKVVFEDWRIQRIAKDWSHFLEGVLNSRPPEAIG